MTICPFRYSLSVFRYYVYVPLLFVRYVIRCPLLVGSVPLPFVSVPLPFIRYYVSVTIYPSMRTRLTDTQSIYIEQIKSYK